MKSKVITVNEKDEVIGSEYFEVALEKELIRRIARIFLFDERGNVYLQHRSSGMKLFPDRWDQSAGGHVDVGEGYEDAAKRELEEELGLKNQTLKSRGVYYCEEMQGGLRLKMFNGLFEGSYDGKPIVWDEEEVKGGTWVSSKDLDRLIETEPDNYTPGMIIAWKQLRYLPAASENS